MLKNQLNKILKDKNFAEKFGVTKTDCFSLLGQGEYNVNYLFYSERYGEKLILRIATASQMHLEGQIEYEFKTLKLLEGTSRTPKVYYYNNNDELYNHGFLVMEYLPGQHLNYEIDLTIAADILADIHNVSISGPHHLITPTNPLKAIFEECLVMFDLYKKSPYAKANLVNIIEQLLKKGENIKEINFGKRTIINTELNSANFLINGAEENNYLIDWEKPLFGYPAQDLGHFLAPTTTFFRTDSILRKDEIMNFVNEYCQKSNQYSDAEQLWQSVKSYLAMNCLRGITWCSMAYVQYLDSTKLIANEGSFSKITAYLNAEFLLMIRNEYLDDY